MSGLGNVTTTSSGLASIPPELVPLLAAWMPFDKTLGAYLLGAFAGLMLYGLGVHQLYRYYTLFPTDDLYIRVMVAVVMLLETAHAVLTMHTCYFYLVTNYFNFLALLEGVWSLYALPVLLSGIMITSQVFFARRVFLIGTRYRIIVGIAMLCFVGEICFTIATTVLTFRSPLLGTAPSTVWLVPSTFAAAFLADTLFTVTLIVVLRRSRSGHTGLKRPNETLFDKFMLYAVSTGLLHCIFNFISLILTTTTFHTFIYIFFSIISARLYANSLLAVLNSRAPIAGRGLEVFDAGTYDLHLLARVQQRAAKVTWNVPQAPERAQASIAIKVTTESEGWDSKASGLSV
ncbi:uncharacterized protein BXZ73DRAFT_100289 [Epithele typhae]|uniref:uncharacterized protein n=1 Tax=Epithele typhae TaxID=378194 RepID=UPI0020073A0F|nr:uncharacterized protein BXZ73DRAFT_100289 [Epithele typhae]KAH9936874.1 hypothetical protein BXZ73DRAFT_100289 [Epithele typhae]